MIQYLLDYAIVHICEHNVKNKKILPVAVFFKNKIHKHNFIPGGSRVMKLLWGIPLNEKPIKTKHVFSSSYQEDHM